MAVIHRTALTPTKLELLTSWLPSRPWYVGGAGAPELAKSGGFRLDDPQGEVGIEFMVVTDTSGTDPTAYLVPLTYRGAPLDGAEHALVGIMEHGVLGRRWAYDGCHDPVAVAQLFALVEGRVQAQDQNSSDTPDRDVTCSHTGEGLISADLAVTATDDRDGTALAVPSGATLRLNRVLRPVQDAPRSLPQAATGHIAGSWSPPSGPRARGLFAVVHARG
ncbi:1,4-alpha-glucan branching protein [Streptomyces sp. NBC_01310]|uniref:maltokinase N-terminal cap-like domain-containing protein n=1 Tax=unclassified Streptomyces TaxID=2593676 RepID=UPI002DD8C0BC|nr:1,4-alpha-glucan branching protein [Streptomyces sp. NBC_01294]WRZ56234.1 1,4-alpha-glucan branching protein [Streptomyces sp. NBC_01294]WSJ62002.1 1,4-alpha-glucan branching protein [Streptomyces sp. NBC_01310]